MHSLLKQKFRLLHRLLCQGLYHLYSNEVWKLEDGKLVKETNFQKGQHFSGEKTVLSMLAKEAAKEKAS